MMVLFIQKMEKRFFKSFPTLIWLERLRMIKSYEESIENYKLNENKWHARYKMYISVAGDKISWSFLE
jgi:hypothetical protein